MSTEKATIKYTKQGDDDVFELSLYQGFRRIAGHLSRWRMGAIGLLQEEYRLTQDDAEKAVRESMQVPGEEYEF